MGWWMGCRPGYLADFYPYFARIYIHTYCSEGSDAGPRIVSILFPSLSGTREG